MSQGLLQEQADRIAKRIDPSKVTKSATAIASILLSVIPMLISCWTKEDEPDPAKTAAAIKEKNDENPKRLRRRTAIAIRRDAPRKERPSAAEAAVYADAMIADACETAENAPEVVEALCRAYGG
jgi:hypothetical protein